MQTTERYKHKEINTYRMGLLSVHGYPHRRMSESGKRMRNSKRSLSQETQYEESYGWEQCQSRERAWIQSCSKEQKWEGKEERDREREYQRKRGILMRRWFYWHWQQKKHVSVRDGRWWRNCWLSAAGLEMVQTWNRLSEKRGKNWAAKHWVWMCCQERL